MITLKYILFALISTMVNIVFQWFSFLIYDGFLALYIAMFLGTLAGLVLKYILDKKYIFFHTTKSKQDNRKKFILYSMMGIFTTLIFWSFEISFEYIFEYQNAKYYGGILGLTIGYIIKYFLDKKYVFINKD
jgi:putative flippase GtrA